MKTQSSSTSHTFFSTAPSMVSANSMHSLSVDSINESIKLIKRELGPLKYKVNNETSNFWSRISKSLLESYEITQILITIHVK